MPSHGALCTGTTSRSSQPPMPFGSHSSGRRGHGVEATDRRCTDSIMVWNLTLQRLCAAQLLLVQHANMPNPFAPFGRASYQRRTGEERCGASKRQCQPFRDPHPPPPSINLTKTKRLRPLVGVKVLQCDARTEPEPRGASQKPELALRGENSEPEPVEVKRNH